MVKDNWLSSESSGTVGEEKVSYQPVTLIL